MATLVERVSTLSSEAEKAVQDMCAADDKNEVYELHGVDCLRMKTDREGVKAELLGQLETIGFLTLSNMPGYDEAKLMKACVALHAIPEEAKREMFLKKDNPENVNFYRGYQPFFPKDPSHKEFLDMGMPTDNFDELEKSLPLGEATPFVKAPEYAWILETLHEAQESINKASMEIVGLLAEGLGKPTDFFDPWFQGGSLSTFRSIHYLPRSAGIVDSSGLSADESRLTTPEHADSGFLTFLSTFGYPGLEVLVDGVYRQVKPKPNTITVNIGDLFARLTGYRLKATYHRVRDIGIERFSAPFFLEPKYSAKVPLDLLSGERQNAAENMPEGTTMYGDWLVRRMQASYVEWKNFDLPPSRAAAIQAVDLSEFRN